MDAFQGGPTHLGDVVGDGPLEQHGLLAHEGAYKYKKDDMRGSI